ncbi:hypothetical protein HGM15179_013799 [Zosterops borbonicus]|uniref:Uncharacterized protein n=1 Tax=Zosterops borbonicus TaxID=364589 RepID=A0A8K1LGN3_9PASS|nr:hypothetical protein HGM15179_013799 [Zosterops borbonicus]
MEKEGKGITATNVESQNPQGVEMPIDMIFSSGVITKHTVGGRILEGLKAEPFPKTMDISAMELMELVLAAIVFSLVQSLCFYEKNDNSVQGALNSERYAACSIKVISENFGLDIGPFVS